jgi:hypothetical protein
MLCYEKGFLIHAFNIQQCRDEDVRVSTTASGGASGLLIDDIDDHDGGSS